MIRIWDIIEIVAYNFGVSPHDLASSTHKPAIVQPKYVAMHLARQLTSYSFVEIARVFNCDHTTVLRACEHVAMKLEDKNFEGRVKAISKVVDYHEKLAAAGEVDVLGLAKTIMKNPLRTAGMASTYQIAAMARLFLDVWEIAKAGEALAQTFAELPFDSGEDDQERFRFLREVGRAVIEDMASIRNPNEIREEKGK
jgi:hypothetical protein